MKQDGIPRIKEDVQHELSDDFSLVGLKAMVALLGLALLVIALTVDNKWVLAGVGAWVILP